MEGSVLQSLQVLQLTENMENANCFSTTKLNMISQ